MNLSALIVDDEEYSRKSLYFLLEENCPTVKVAGIAKSVAEARQVLSSHAVDVIFLDIAMPKENGFELLSSVKPGTSVIFTTAYDQYALKAIKASAVDYLLKPISISELKSAVEKVESLHSLQKNNLQGPVVQSLTENLGSKEDIPKITLPHSQGFYVIPKSDIIYIEADDNYSIFYLKSGEKRMVTKLLKELEEIIDSERFVRVHKSTLINIDHLKDYSTRNGCEATMSDGTIVQVSRRRVPEFFEKVKKFFNK